MKYLLHIDTSTDIGTIAISCEGVLLAAKTNNEAKNHASNINLLINELMDIQQIAFGQIAAIAICAGPGSYTGLRIGMATAKGICYALDLPILPQNRLSLLANQVFEQDKSKFVNYISLLYAREKEFFIAIYDQEFTCTLSPIHVNEQQLKEILFPIHDAVIITNIDVSFLSSLDIRRLKIVEDITLNLFSWTKYAFLQLENSKNVKLSLVEPFYLKQVYTHN